jgi:acetyltransferase-like isoleucine patch superfamily enzyme
MIYTLSKGIRKLLHILEGWVPSMFLRRKILQILGAEVSNNVYIGQGLIVANGGDGSIKELIIENNVAISPRVILVLHIDPSPSPLARIYKKGQQKIHIKEGVWIGAGSIILSDVVIGEYSIVAAGAVVTKDVPPYTVFGGVPAKKINNIDPNFMEE